jgi:UrcA family protein
MKTLSIAAILALLASPALAGTQDVPFPTREQVSIKVSTSGIDLNSAAGRERLRARMNRAIATVCNQGDVYSAYQSKDTQCYQEMAQSATAQTRGYALNIGAGSDVAKN